MSSLARPKVSPIAGAIIEAVAPGNCEAYLRGLIDEPTKAATTLDMRWLLALSDDGVTWGRYDMQHRRWYFGYEIVPEVAPRIRRETLQELRIFGAQAELLIWRTDHEFCGRLLKDDMSVALRPAAGDPLQGVADPLRPSPNEYRIIRGDDLEASRVGNDGYSTCKHEFSHLVDGAGAQQVIPLRLSRDDLKDRKVCLGVRHYYQSIVDSGAVRIAVTRCVNVLVRGPE